MYDKLCVSVRAKPLNFTNVTSLAIISNHINMHYANLHEFNLLYTHYNATKAFRNRRVKYSTKQMFAHEEGV